MLILTEEQQEMVRYNYHYKIKITAAVVFSLLITGALAWMIYTTAYNAGTDHTKAKEDAGLLFLISLAICLFFVSVMKINKVEGRVELIESNHCGQKCIVIRCCSDGPYSDAITNSEWLDDTEKSKYQKVKPIIDLVSKPFFWCSFSEPKDGTFRTVIFQNKESGMGGLGIFVDGRTMLSLRLTLWGWSVKILRKKVFHG